MGLKPQSRAAPSEVPQRFPALSFSAEARGFWRHKLMPRKENLAVFWSHIAGVTHGRPGGGGWRGLKRWAGSCGSPAVGSNLKPDGQETPAPGDTLLTLKSFSYLSPGAAVDSGHNTVQAGPLAESCFWETKSQKRFLGLK